MHLISVHVWLGGVCRSCMIVLYYDQSAKPEHKRSMSGFAVRLKLMSCLLRSTEAANIPALAVQVFQPLTALLCFYSFIAAK